MNANSGWMARPIGIALGVRVALFVIGDIAEYVIRRVPYTGPLMTWQHWDAKWYVMIARTGYTYSPVHSSLVDFFPLYPLVIWLTSHLLGWIPHADPILLAAFVISWLSFAGACVLLYRITLERFDRATATGAVLLLAFFPFSFYYGAPFSESLYLLLALTAFFGIERHRWWLASGAALLAGAARPGLIVGACVVVAYGLDWLRTRHALRRDILALALTPLGVAAYGGYCWLRFGDPLAYLKTSRAGWHGAHLQLGAVHVIWVSITQPQGWLVGRDYFARLSAIYTLLLLLCIASLYPIARLLGTPYVLYTLMSFLLPIATYPTVHSLGRYLSVAFPTFMVFAYGLRRRPAPRGGVVVASALSLAVFTVLFVSGYALS